MERPTDTTTAPEDESTSYASDPVLWPPGAEGLWEPLTGLSLERDRPAVEEVQRLAGLYQCEPAQLVSAAGRQLRRVDGDESPSHEHRDVLALEVVAKLSVLARTPVDELPDVEDSNIALIKHIRHIQGCAECLAATNRYVALFPTDDDIRRAQPLSM